MTLLIVLIIGLLQEAVIFVTKIVYCMYMYYSHSTVFNTDLGYSKTTDAIEVSEKKC